MLMHLLPDRSNCSCRSAVCVVNMPNCAVKLEAELQKGKMCIYMEKKKKKSIFLILSELWPQILCYYDFAKNLRNFPKRESRHLRPMQVHSLGLYYSSEML